MKFTITKEYIPFSILFAEFVLLVVAVALWFGR